MSRPAADGEIKLPDPATAKTIETLVAKLAPTLIEPAKGFATNAKEKLQIKFEKGFSEFVRNQVERYSTVKTIISSSIPIDLRSVYVNLNLLAPRNTAYRDDDLIEAISKIKFILFTATAGSGKSMLMRYLYLHFLEIKSDRLPIFLNLRDLNNAKDPTIFSLILGRLSDHISGLSDRQLEYALKIGKVILFLDGFDKIDHDKRSLREIEINELAGKYGKLQMFVSSRPAETFANWALFSVLAVQPFSRKQVELLIDKLEFDNEMKDLFKIKLEAGLYRTHREFLTNPLLVVMMLITLSEFAEIPAKIHLFYERAFDALYGKHDATKEGRFERKRYTNIAIDDFKRLFSYFSIISYSMKKTDFSDEDLRKILKDSIKAAQIDVRIDDYKKDLIESTCMIIKDGLDFVYSHRSFQEYFVAYFISRIKMSDFDKFAYLLNSRALFDNVFLMLAEMSKEKFEEGWALPKLRELEHRVSGVDARKNPFIFASKIFHRDDIRASIDHDSIDVHIFGRDTESDIVNVRSALYRIYGVFEELNKLSASAKREEKKLLSEILRNSALTNDPRLKEFRNSKTKLGPNEIIELSLSETDDEWLSKTVFGNFIAHEADMIVKLRKEVEDRVAERSKGLGDILSIALD